MEVLLIFIPIVLTTTAHMFVVKFDWFSFLKRPISRYLFGENKTWRGFLFVIIVNALLMGAIGYAKLGAFLGLGYVLFELPKSFMKRRLGIEPGGKANKGKYFFMTIDRLDSAAGVVIFYYLMFPLSPMKIILYILLGMLIHLSFSSTLYFLKVKKSL